MRPPHPRGPQSALSSMSDAISAAVSSEQRLALETLREVSEHSSEQSPPRGHNAPAGGGFHRPRSVRGDITQEIVGRYGAVLAQRDLDAERLRIAAEAIKCREAQRQHFGLVEVLRREQGGEQHVDRAALAALERRMHEEVAEAVLVVGEHQEHASLSSALRFASKASRTKPTIIYLKGDVFDECESLDLDGHVFIQPDPDHAGQKPVIRISGPHVGFKCVTASAQVTFAGVRLELDSPCRRPMSAVPINTKPLVHPAGNGHCTMAKGFISGVASEPSRCVNVTSGHVTLQSCLVVNLSGDGVHVSLQGLVVLEDTHVKAVARHGVVVTAQGVASLERCILSGSGACGCVVSGIDSCAHLESSTSELNKMGGLLCESGGQVLLQSVNVLRNGGAGVLVRGRGSTLIMNTSSVEANERDGVLVTFDTAAGCKTGDVTRVHAPRAARNDPLMQMKGWTPMPHARHAAGHGGGQGGAGGVLAELSGCNVRANAGSGVRVQQALAGCKIRKSKIESNGADGISAENGGEAKIFESRIEDNSGRGARAHGRGARCLLASCSLVSNRVGVSAEGGEVRMHMCKMGRNCEGEVERANGGLVQEQKTCEAEGQWVEASDGVPPRLLAELPWLAKLREKLKTNTLRTWHGFS